MPMPTMTITPMWAPRSDERVKRAATEQRMRNLYEHLQQFKKMLEPQDSESSVMDVPAPEEVMKELSAYRARVLDMKLDETQSTVFYLHANHYARRSITAWRITRNRE